MKTTLLFSAVLCIGVQPLLAQTSTDTPSAISPAITPATTTGDSAASAKSWLIGNWIFDEEFTQQKRRKTTTDQQPQAGADGQATNATISAPVLDKMKGARLNITDKQIKMARADGTEKTQNYTTTEGSGGDSLELKQEDGQTMRIHRDGERIYTTLEGSNEPIYFKKG